MKMYIYQVTIALIYFLEGAMNLNNLYMKKIEYQQSQLQHMKSQAVKLLSLIIY